MQQIKFKAITTDGKWVDGDLVNTDHFKFILKTRFIPVISLPSSEFVEVIPKTVCQFIDTYRGKNFWQNDTVVHPELGNGVIKWANTGYVVEYSDGYTIDLHEDLGELQITGSIHDHLLINETETCECCGKKFPVSEMRMDEEDANWWCEECLNDMKQ